MALIKDDVFKWIALSGTIVSVPLGILTLSEKNHGITALFITSTIALATLSLILFWNSNKKNPIESSDNIELGGDVIPDFEIISTYLKIDILDNGKDAKFEYRRRIRCLVQSVNEFYYRFKPFSKFSGFEHFPGKALVVEDCDAAEVTALLDNHYNISDELDITLKAFGSNIFTKSSNEFWELGKAYKGVDSHLVEIYFPKDSDEIVTIRSCILKNDINKTKKALKKNFPVTLRNGHQVITVKTQNNELKVGEKLRIEWFFDC